MATKTLQFQKSGSEWVAEVTVNNDSHLHIERKAAKSIFRIEQRGADNQMYVTTRLPKGLEYTGVAIDEDVQATCYPKQLRIVSGSEVTLGVITENEQ